MIKNRFTMEEVATIFRGRAAMVVNGGHDGMLKLDEQVIAATTKEGYEKLSEKELYWITRWLAAGVQEQQIESKNMKKYLNKTATIADVFAILGKSNKEMWGDDILENPEGPKEQIQLAIVALNALLQALYKKDVVKVDEIKEAQLEWKEKLKEIPNPPTDSPAQEEQSSEEGDSESSSTEPPPPQDDPPAEPDTDHP